MGEQWLGNASYILKKTKQLPMEIGNITLNNWSKFMFFTWEITIFYNFLNFSEIKHMFFFFFEKKYNRKPFLSMA